MKNAIQTQPKLGLANITSIFMILDAKDIFTSKVYSGCTIFIVKVLNRFEIFSIKFFQENRVQTISSLTISY